MFGGLNRLLVSGLVAGAVLALPPAAFACNSGVSAVNVYKECTPSGSGGKSTGGSKGHSTGGTQSSGTPTTTTAVVISKKTAVKLKKAGNNGRSLKHLVRAFGSDRFLQSSSAPASAPTAVGSAFDLGSGPTALLIILAGTAVLLLVATGVRGARQRRP